MIGKYRIPKTASHADKELEMRQSRVPISAKKTGEYINTDSWLIGEKL